MAGIATRKPLSRRVRFEVFKRDGFVCQYCGAHPPAWIALARMPHSEYQRFKYFCGVCWKMLKDEQNG